MHASDQQRKDSAGRSKPTGLVVVATPIGNRADITQRALDVLGAADRVLCEDTRLTGRLLAHHGVEARLSPYHEHNASRVRPGIVAALKAGETVALVSDAGTPLISDPGYKLVRAAIDVGVAVSGCPGPSAPLLALTVSGLPTDRFYFAGFLPARENARRRVIESVAGIDATLIFLESPRRLAAALADLAAELGARPATIARELTKRFETVHRDHLAALAEHYAEAGAPKGEIVIVVAGAEAGQAQAMTDGEIDDRLDDLLESMSVRDAAAVIAEETGQPKRAIYARAVARRHAAR